MLKRLRQFHEQCCALLANGESPQSLILELELKPFEMPAVTTSVVDCGFGSDQENRRHAGLILHQPHEVVRAFPDGALYHAGGQFCVVDHETGLIEFCLLFEARVLPILGDSATQVRLWARCAPPGLTSDVFFDAMLGRRFTSMVSDAVQTESAARFWKIRLRDAHHRGFRVGMQDGERLDFCDPAQSFASWWSTTAAPRGRHCVITTHFATSGSV